MSVGERYVGADIDFLGVKISSLESRFTRSQVFTWKYQVLVAFVTCQMSRTWKYQGTRSHFVPWTLSPGGFFSSKNGRTVWEARLWEQKGAENILRSLWTFLRWILLIMSSCWVRDECRESLQIYNVESTMHSKECTCAWHKPKRWQTTVCWIQQMYSHFPEWNVNRCAMEHPRKDRSGWSWLQWENAFLQFMKLCVMCIPTEHQWVMHFSGMGQKQWDIC